MKNGDYRSCLFLFNDDSSLISAVKTSRLLSKYNIVPYFAYVTRAHYVTVSERQMDMILGREADFSMSMAAILNVNFLCQFDFVYSAKYVKQARDRIKDGSLNSYHRRPVFLSAFPGLELLPEIGLKSRSSADVLCFNSRSDLELAKATTITTPCETVRFCSMLYTEFDQPPHAPERVRSLLFIPQNALPLKREGRQHVAEVISEIASAHPDCRIKVKLRQEMGENSFHTHREYVSYRSLLSDLLPEGRISYDSGAMEDAVRHADAVLTCTSTGAAEALALGVPAMFYTAYPGASEEPQHEGVQRLFEGSGLQVTREQAIDLQVPVATEQWWRDNMTRPADVQVLVAAMREAYARVIVAAHC